MIAIGKFLCVCLVFKVNWSVLVKGEVNDVFERTTSKMLENPFIKNNNKNFLQTEDNNEGEFNRFVSFDHRSRNIHWRIPNIYPFFPFFKYTPVSVPAVTSTITVFQQVTEKETAHPTCLVAEYTARWKTCGKETIHSTSTNIDYDDDTVTETSAPFIHEQIFSIKPSKSSPIPFNTLSPEIPGTGLLEGSMHDYDYYYREDRNLPLMLGTRRRHGNIVNNDDIITTPLSKELLFVNNDFNVETTTKYVTETISVTKVDKYMNYETTMTLLMKDCIPPSNTIPYCTEYSSHSSSYPKIPLFFYHPIKLLTPNNESGNNNNNNEIIINSIVNSVSDKVANEMEMAVTIDAFNSQADDDFELLFMDYDEKLNKTN